MKQHKKSHGFTLLELIVTMTIMAIAVGFGVPSYQQMVANSQMLAAGNDLIILVNNSRAQAMRTRSRVVVCPTVNGTSCGGENWARAISGIDANRNDTLDNGETVLRRASLGSRVVASNAATLPLIFLPDGTARMGDATNDGIVDTKAVVICVTGSNAASRIVNVGFSSAQTQIEHGEAGECQ